MGRGRRPTFGCDAPGASRTSVHRGGWQALHSGRSHRTPCISLRGGILPSHAGATAMPPDRPPARTSFDNASTINFAKKRVGRSMRRIPECNHLKTLLLLLLLLHQFNGLFSKTTWVSPYQKGKKQSGFKRGKR